MAKKAQAKAVTEKPVKKAADIPFVGQIPDHIFPKPLCGGCGGGGLSQPLTARAGSLPTPAPTRAYHPTFDPLPLRAAENRGMANALRNRLGRAVTELQRSIEEMAATERYLATYPDALADYDHEEVDLDVARAFCHASAQFLDAVKPVVSGS
jgi:hypothetical protein